ncbi:Imm1 family immunity protein [Streptomyces sp. NPDC003691]
MRSGVEARYRPAHAEAPELLRGPADVDALFDSLLTGPVHENLAQLHSLERPLLPSGYPDHELLIGADRNRQVGLLAFLDAEGNVVTAGTPDGEVQGRYCIMGHLTEFPPGSELPLDAVRRAVKEFVSSGGCRPASVPWRAPTAW